MLNYVYYSAISSYYILLVNYCFSLHFKSVLRITVWSLSLQPAGYSVLLLYTILESRINLFSLPHHRLSYPLFSLILLFWFHRGLVVTRHPDEGATSPVTTCLQHGFLGYTSSQQPFSRLASSSYVSYGIYVFFYFNLFLRFTYD